MPKHGSAWGERSDRVLIRVFAHLEPGADEKAIRRAVRDAYPFGERKFWPYKKWLERVRAWKAARAVGLTVPQERNRRRRIIRDERQIPLL